MLSPKEKKCSPLALTAVLLILTVLFYFNGERWLRQFLLYLSSAHWARNLINNLDLAWRVASRFVAGETIDEALKVSQRLRDRGMLVTLDYLGESVTDQAMAEAARDEILTLLDEIRARDIDAYVSVKLSQLGLKIDEKLALENLRQLVARAQRHQNQIRIDMEESALVDVTLRLYRHLRHQEKFDNVGVVLQSYLYRSEDDARQLINEGAWIRLCKGAYAEPPEVAFVHKKDTDANFMKLAKMMLSQDARDRGVYLAVATHDEKIIAATIDFVQANQIPPDAFEFQMLYGIRQEMQEALVKQGYRVRIYVPYGAAWYPYFMRRLAERPANLWFFISNLLRR